MATITLNDLAKDIEGGVRFAFAHTEFALTGDESYESTDPSLVADAAAHPYLKVAFAEDSSALRQIEQQAEDSKTSDDPRVNPRADHLSAVADPEVVEAAQAKNEAIRRTVAGETPEAQEQSADTTQPGTADSPEQAPARAQADPPTSEENTF